VVCRKPPTTSRIRCHQMELPWKKNAAFCEGTNIVMDFSRVCSPLSVHGRSVQRFRGGLAFKAHGLLYHSTLGLRVRKKKKNAAFCEGTNIVMDFSRVRSPLCVPGRRVLFFCEGANVMDFQVHDVMDFQQGLPPLLQKNSAL